MSAPSEADTSSTEGPPRRRDATGDGLASPNAAADVSSASRVEIAEGPGRVLRPGVLSFRAWRGVGGGRRLVVRGSRDLRGGSGRANRAGAWRPTAFGSRLLLA